MSVKPITDSLPLSCKGEETILLKQIAQNTQSAAQAARQQLLLSKIRLGLTGFLTALVLLAFLLWGPRLHRSLQNADHAFDSLEMVASQLVQADIPCNRSIGTISNTVHLCIDLNFFQPAIIKAMTSHCLKLHWHTQCRTAADNIFC